MLINTSGVKQSMWMPLNKERVQLPPKVCSKPIKSCCLGKVGRVMWQVDEGNNKTEGTKGICSCLCDKLRQKVLDMWRVTRRAHIKCLSVWKFGNLLGDCEGNESETSIWKRWY